MFGYSVPDCVTFPMSPFLFVIDQNDSFFKPKWILYFKKITFKILNGYDRFQKHDIDIFINDTWQKYAGDAGQTSLLTNKKVNLHFEAGKQEMGIFMH